MLHEEEDYEEEETGLVVINQSSIYGGDEDIIEYAKNRRINAPAHDNQSEIEQLNSALS